MSPDRWIELGLLCLVMLTGVVTYITTTRYESIRKKRDDRKETREDIDERIAAAQADKPLSAEGQVRSSQLLNIVNMADLLADLVRGQREMVKNMAIMMAAITTLTNTVQEVIQERLPNRRR